MNIFLKCLSIISSSFLLVSCSCEIDEVEYPPETIYEDFTEGNPTESKYVLQHGDIEFSLNREMVSKSFGSLINTVYKGQYLQGDICSSPNFHLKINQLKLKGRSALNLLKPDASSYFLEPEVGVRLHVDDCAAGIRINASVDNCNSAAQKVSLDKPFNLKSICDMEMKFSTSILPISYTEKERVPLFKDPIKPVLDYPDGYELVLDNTESFAFEFGEYVDNKWVPNEDRNVKHIPFTTSVRGHGDSYRTTAEEVIVDDAKVMTGVLNVGKKFYLTTDDLDEAKNYYTRPSHLNLEKDIYQIRINQSFFLKKARNGEISGFFGEALPIRVKGSGFDIVLTGGDVKFGKLNGKNVIRIGLEARNFQDRVLIENSDIHLLLSEPVISEGNLITQVIGAKLKFSNPNSWFGACFNEDLLQLIKFVESGKEHRENNPLTLKILKINNELDIKAPSCINIDDNERVVVLDDNKKLCPDKKYMNRTGNLKNQLILVDERRSESFISDQTIFVNLDAEIKEYDAKPWSKEKKQSP